MLRELSRSWWLILLRGIAGIVFGILAVIWPGLTLLTLILLYSAYALVDGLFALIAVFAGKGRPLPRWWLILVGLAGIAVGVLTF